MRMADDMAGGCAVTDRLLLRLTLLTLPSFATFFDEKDDDRQGCHAVDPPSARHEKLHDQPEQDDAG